MQRSILIIEDNSDIANLIGVNLRDKHMQVSYATDGETGLEMAMIDSYDLIILDLMLPVLDGMAVCRSLRRKQNFTPVLMLTAKTSELDRVMGLEVGADDYLTKPFSVPELEARINAILRRTEQYQQPKEQETKTTRTYDELQLDSQRRLVRVAEQDIELTAKEFDLLWHFASNPGRVYTRSQLLTSVWGYAHSGYEHTVNSHINRLRAKIETDPAKPKYVQTVWGVGYKFSDHIQADS